MMLPPLRTLQCLGLAYAMALGGGFALPSAIYAESVRTERFQSRSVSSSGQFVIYCPDTRLRLAVTKFVETAKAATLAALGIPDQWKVPIVVTMVPPETTRPGMPLVREGFVHTDEGVKIDIVVALREEQFYQVQFPQMVIRAVLMEVAYRNKPPLTAEENIQPPGWLVEAITDKVEVRQAGKNPNAAIFRTMMATGRIPPIREFLEGNVSRMDATARTIYSECSASLLDMLMALPGGKRSLYQAVRNLRISKGDPVEFLLQNFPTLGNSETALERWWTLGLARYSASDRYLALTVAETDARLAPLLQIQVMTDVKSGEKETFLLSDYPKFIRMQASRAPLVERSGELTELHLQAHPLMRPVVAEYQRIVRQMAEGKSRGLEKPLAEIANYRTMIVGRSGQITDYLNWFEATQMPERSGAFDGYLRVADGLQKVPQRKRDDALTRYVDQMEREFQ